MISLSKKTCCLSFVLLLSVAAIRDSHARSLLRKGERREESIPNGPYPDNWPFMAQCLDSTSPGGLHNTTLHTCSDNASSDLNKNDRIAIVGAGPSGISMAYLLKKRGFTDITIFEKEGRIGGKSKSAKIGGDKFDLGTIYTSNKYECVELLFDEFGINEVDIGSQGKPRILSDPTILDPPLSVFPLWNMKYTTNKYGIPFADPSQYIAQFSQDVQNYTTSWTQSMGSFDYYFPDENTINFELINSSFLEWLEQHELYAMIPQLHIAVSGQGYGSLGEIPAFYGLTWIHPNFFVAGGSFSVVKEDWQTLWERIVDALNLQVNLETSITKIERKNNSINILYRNEGEEPMISQKFDKLIMAMPMPDGLDLLDASDEEIELFSRYNFKSVKMDLGNLTVNEGPLADIDFELFSFMDKMDQQTDYHVKSFNNATGELSRYQWKTDGNDGIVTIIRQAMLKNRDQNVDIAQLWSIVALDDLDGPKDNITAEAAAELAALGVDFEQIVTNRVPDYMPWKNNTDVVENRVPWRIWDYQGSLNTWFIGSYVSFESVADVLDYNLKLVNERVCIPS